MSRDDSAENDEGFLSRWSRRKREVAAPMPAPVVAQPEPGSEPDDRPKDPETGEIIDQDLVSSLPDIATLQPGADLSAFMRKGVPEAVRRRALRALWSADPAIRDFVSPALDYAYDYNAPGGAPGYGPLSDADIAQAKEFLAGVFSDTPSVYSQPSHVIPLGDSDTLPQAVQPAPETAPDAVRRTHTAVHNEFETDAATGLEASNTRAENAPELPQFPETPVVQRNISERGADPLSAENQTIQSKKRRRGGSATPV